MTLSIETSDGVQWLTLNRPEKLNALDAATKLELEDALASAATDASVRCLVLTGAGRGFCAGGDRPPTPDATSAAIETAIDKIDRRTAELTQAGKAAALLYRMAKPTIAMINGPCAGAGLSLAAACDLRIAGDAVMLTSAFIRIGLAGDYGGAWYWSRIIGASRTRRLYMLSERFSGAEALDFGLIDFLVPDAELRDKTGIIAAALAAGSARGHRLMKASLNAAATEPLDAYLEQEALNMALSDV